VDTNQAQSSHVRLGRGPFIFSGIPPILSGELEVANTSEEKLKLRTIPVIGHRDKSAPNLGLDELRVGVRLLPQQRASAPAHFLVDAYTPPGSYAAALSIGGQEAPIVVHVFEKLDLRIEPSRVRMLGAGGDVLTQQIVVSNRGNVTETLRELALVFLEERNWVNRSLVYALRETGEGEGHQQYLDRVVKELRGTLARPARITVRGEVTTLAPGETAQLELQITLPRELVKGRVYIGSTPFMSGKLAFEIECNGAVNSPKRRPR
jgi:hypothetical protein